MPDLRVVRVGLYVGFVGLHGARRIVEGIRDRYAIQEGELVAGNEVEDLLEPACGEVRPTGTVEGLGKGEHRVGIGPPLADQVL